VFGKAWLPFNERPSFRASLPFSNSDRHDIFLLTHTKTRKRKRGIVSEVIVQ
jgi:hypothetical protein